MKENLTQILMNEAIREGDGGSGWQRCGRYCRKRMRSVR